MLNDAEAAAIIEIIGESYQAGLEAGYGLARKVYIEPDKAVMEKANVMLYNSLYGKFSTIPEHKADLEPGVKDLILAMKNYNVDPDQLTSYLIKLFTDPGEVVGRSLQDIRTYLKKTVYDPLGKGTL